MNTINRMVSPTIFLGLRDNVRNLIVKEICVSNGLTFEALLKIISTESGLLEEEIKEKSRKQERVRARVVFSAISRKIMFRTYQSIADYLDKDHATICHHVKSHYLWIGPYKEYTDLYNRVLKKCSQFLID